MSVAENDRAAVERLLWDEIERHQVGMLTLPDGQWRHAQPMTAFVDGRDLWFFTPTDSKLALSIGAGREAVFVFQAKDLYACLSGALTLIHDEARIAKYWNAVSAAWHPGGRNDPHLTMMRLEAARAEVWSTQVGPIRFAWEIALANARKHEPQIGGRTSLQFH